MKEEGKPPRLEGTRKMIIPMIGFSSSIALEGYLKLKEEAIKKKISFSAHIRGILNEHIAKAK